MNQIADTLDFSNAEVIDKRIKTNEDFIWTIEVPLTGKIIIDVEFLDLKVLSQDVSLERCFNSTIECLC